MSKITEFFIIGIGLLLMGYWTRMYNENFGNGIIIIGWIICCTWAITMALKYIDNK